MKRLFLVFIFISWCFLFSHSSENTLFIKPIEHVSQENFDSWAKEKLTLGNSSLQMVKDISDRHGFHHQNFIQTYNGIEIANSSVKAHYKEGLLYLVNGEIYSAENIISTENYDQKYLFRKILSHLNVQVNKISSSSQVIFFPKNNNTVELAREFTISSSEPLFKKKIIIGSFSEEILSEIDLIKFADATGTATTKYSGVQTIITDSISPTSYRLIESGRGGGIETLNMQQGYFSTVDFTDDDNNWNNINTAQDEVATDAHWASEMFYDYLQTTFGRNSYDDAGSKLTCRVHYAPVYASAFWNGSSVTIGDGDGSSYGPLTTIDVIAHEFAHGIIESTANLNASYEPGALGESFADIFGTAVEFYAKPSSANYTIKEDASLTGSFDHSLMNPKATGQPDTYQQTNWATGSADNGGIHTNCGVQNFWFYLLVNGGSGTNDNSNSYNVSGIGMANAMNIVYRALTVYHTSNSQYSDARTYAIQAAEDLFGACSPEVEAVTRAWYAVGVGADYSSAPASAGFSANSTFSCTVPATISFTDLSTNAVNYNWDFGDGNMSTNAIASNTYTSAGNYTVQQIVSGVGCATTPDTLTFTNYITIVNGGGPTPPFCAPDAVNQNQYYGITNVSFNSINHTSPNSISENYMDLSCSQQTTVDAGSTYSLSIATGYEYAYAWIDYDNSGTFDVSEQVYASSFRTGTHSTNVTIPGSATQSTPLRLRVGSSYYTLSADGCGIPSRGQYEDYSITIIPNTSPPSADFVANQTTINVGASVNFTDVSAGLPTGWVWEFDGAQQTSSNLQNPTGITYNSTGTFRVKLVASNAFGSDTVIKYNYITVTNTASMCSSNYSSASSGLLYDSGGPTGYYLNIESCSFLIDPGCSTPITLHFNSFNLEQNYDYLTVYDGNNTSGPLLLYASGSTIPSDVIANSGQMYLVFSSDGSITRPGFEATWNAPAGSTLPVSNFSVSNNNPPFNSEVLFTDLTSNSPNGWQWDFGDGNFAFTQNPSHAYTSSGQQIITLIASNCSSQDTISDTIIVQTPPQVLFHQDTLFAQVACGSSSSDSILIENVSGGELSVIRNEAFAPFDSTSVDSFTISGYNTIHTFSGVASNADSISLTIGLSGDYDASSEYAIIYIEGTFIGIFYPGVAFTYAYRTYSLGGPQLASWLADGIIEVTVDNTSAVNIGLNYNSVQIVSAGQAWLRDSTSTFTALAGDSVYLPISFDASNLYSGLYIDSVLVETNDTGFGDVYLPVYLTVSGAPSISATPSSIDFDTLMVGATANDTVVISNNGCDTLRISNVLSTSSSFFTSWTTGSIEPFGSDTLIVSFNPSSIATYNDTIFLINNDTISYIVIDGVGVGAPVISISTDTLNITTNGCADSVTVPFTIYNTGQSDLDYTIDGAQDNGSSTLEVLALTYGVDMSREYPNTIAAINQHFTNYNLTELNTTSASVLQSALVGIDVVLIPEFESGSSTVGTTIGPILQAFANNGGGIVVCSPSSTARLNYVFNTGLFSGSYTASASGNAVNNVLPSHPIMDGIPASFIGTNASTVLNITNPDAVGLVTYGSGYFAFYRPIGSGNVVFLAPDFYIYNPEVSLLIANAIQWAGYKNQTSWITLSNDSGSVSVIDSSIVNVTFNSTGLASGQYVSSLRVNSNDPVTPTDSIVCILDVVGTPITSLSTNCVAFDSIMTGASVQDSVYLYNTGCDTLFVSGYTTNSGVYTIDTSNFHILPGDSLRIMVEFAPTVIQPYPDTISFTDNSGNTSLCVSGVGVGAPIISVQPTSLTANLGACGDSIVLPMNIFNTGIGNLNYNILGAGDSFDSSSVVNFYTSGATTVHYFSNIPSSDSIHLTITLNGDFDNNAEFATLHIEGASYGIIQDNNAINGTDIIVNYSFGGALVASWLSDGAISVSLVNSFGVGTFVGTEIHGVRLETSGAEWISLNLLNGSINPGDSSLINATFNSEGLSGGQYTTDLLLNSNDPASSQLIVPCTLNVSFEPCADFEYNVPPCGSIVSFSDSSINNPTSRQWDFGDGTTSSLTNPIHTYTSAGTYSVQLIACNGLGCDTTNASVVVNNTIGPITAVCTPASYFPSSTRGITSFNFGSISHTSNYSYIEDYQDFTCSQSTFVNTSISYPITFNSGYEYGYAWIDYNNDGSFSSSELVYQSSFRTSFHNGFVSIPSSAVTSTPLRMRVGSSYFTLANACDAPYYGQYEDYTVTIVPNNSPPLANFSTPQTTIEVGSTINFTDLSGGNPTSWSWEFEGASVSNSSMQNPAGITYNTIGSFWVKLIATNSNGTDTVIKYNYINVVQSANMCSSSGSNRSVGVLYDSGGGSGNYSNNESCSFLIDPGCNSPITLHFDAFNLENSFDYLTVYDGNNTTGPLLLNHTGTSIPADIIANSGSMYIVFNSDVSITRSGFEASWQTTAPASPISANFLISNNSPFTNSPISFTDLSTNTPTSWSWDFGDGNSSTLQNPTHSYTAAGTYTVTLLVNDCFGSSSYSQTVTVNSNVPPTAIINTSSSDPCSGIIEFYDLSSNNPTSWFWDFGDGNTSTLQNPIHTYTNSGSYTIKLIASNSYGNDSSFAAISINLVEIDFSYSTNLNVNEVITFTDNSLNLVSWNWDFGNGNISFQENPSTVYTSPGNYDVRLIGTNSIGCMDTLFKTIQINGVPPIADFNFEIIDSCKNSFSFTDFSLNNPTSWIWDFGDGSVSNAQNPVYTFDTPGIYNVSLVVANALGTDTFTFALSITEFEIDYSYSGTLNTGEVISFTSFAFDAISWQWDFGNGSSSISENPSFVYTDTGTYVVRLIATNTMGCTDSVSYPLTILEPSPPQADFNYMIKDSCDRLISFTDSSYNDPISWFWDFGDGTTSSQRNPQHNYSNDGTYTVSLTVVNDYGPSTYSEMIFVSNGTQISYTYFGSLFSSEEHQFYADSINFTSWAWDFDDGTVSNEASPRHTFLAEGSYVVEVSSVNNIGCESTFSDTLRIVNDTTIVLNDSIYVYPNPSDGVFNVRVTCSSEEKLSFEILNSIGQLMYTEELVDKKEYHILMYAYSFDKGVYYVRVSSAEKTMLKKIIISN